MVEFLEFLEIKSTQNEKTCNNSGNRKTANDEKKSNV